MMVTGCSSGRAGPLSGSPGAAAASARAPAWPFSLISSLALVRPRLGAAWPDEGDSACSCLLIGRLYHSQTALSRGSVGENRCRLLVLRNRRDSRSFTIGEALIGLFVGVPPGFNGN